MKELFSALGSAVFFPLVSLVLPGLTAIAPWFLCLMEVPLVRGVVEPNHTETAFVLMLASIFVGIVVDDIGIRIESLWLDRQRDARTKGRHFSEWWAYLRKPVAIEPSGRRHLRSLVARLKFELGVPVGLVLATPAIWLNPAASNRQAAIVVASTTLLAVYLLTEAAATHEALGRLRHELLRELQAAETASRRIQHRLCTK